MKRLAFPVIVVAAATSLAVMATTAWSDSTAESQPQPICGERNAVVKSLSDQFNERPQAVGMVDKDAVMEVFVSDSGSWTILATGTDGISCLVSSGEGWETKSAVIGVGA